MWGDEAPEGVTPRGRVHRGYAGGPILAPVLEPHERLNVETHTTVARSLRAEYEKGASIRDLAAQTGYSIARVRALLVSAGTSIRPRGKHLN